MVPRESGLTKAPSANGKGTKGGKRLVHMGCVNPCRGFLKINLINYIENMSLALIWKIYLIIVRWNFNKKTLFKATNIN